MTTQALYCRRCGNPLTEEEKGVSGAIYCGACAGQVAAVAPARAAAGEAPTGTGVSPGLAFLLGLIPGVGAIYNMQYVKGLVHVFVFGVLIALAGAAGRAQPELEPLLVMLTMAWIPYMAFEAYHTAKRRERGLRVDEFSSVLPLRGGSLAGPAALIGVGLIVLLNNLGVLRVAQVLRYWPLVLIGLGVYLLYTRLTEPAGDRLEKGEAPHDRNQ